MVDFEEIFKDFPLQKEVSLSKFTTWRVGGNAEYLIQTNNSLELEQLILLARKNNIKFTVLGNGSNILISDQGIKGLVIINKSREIKFGDEFAIEDFNNPLIEHRHSKTEEESYYSFSDLDYNEKANGRFVTFDSGVMLPFAINSSLARSLTGLQWFAGIPGTIGGSLYNNIHGGTKHFSENFYEAKIIDQDGLVKNVDYHFFNFGYDQSIIREISEIVILNVTLQLIYGDLNRAKFTAKEWLKRKSIQPKNSCGSVFQALPPEIQNKLGYPTPSIGYIIDKVLGWKGKTIGQAMISQVHGNFIENVGEAKAADIKNLIEIIQIEVKNRIGIEIEPEINFLGFD